jgi:hypothetical protein
LSFFKAPPTAGRTPKLRMASLFNPDSYQPFYQGLLF